MNFRDLEYVVEAAKLLSFSKAAQRCNVSQPSLSAQIKKLEEELGADIFIRSKRQIFVTPFGESVVAKAQDILAMRDEVHKLANQNKNPLEGKIRLGAILTVAPYLFPQIVNAVQDHAPKMKLSLKEGKTEELLSLLLAGKIDAAIVSLPSDEHVFESQKLFTESFYVAVPEDHPLAKKKFIDEKALRDTDLILLEDGHCFRAQALDVCQSSSARENKVFTATSLETIRRFIESGSGATLMPALAVNKDDGLTYIPFKGDKYTRDVGMIWRKSCLKKMQIDKLMKIIQTL